LILVQTALLQTNKKLNSYFRTEITGIPGNKCLRN
jgi:hypothetical protein